MSREIEDTSIHAMTSVTQVMVTPDLKECKAYISVLGDNQAKEDTLAGLKSASGYIRKELARSINLRNTPEITFYIDESIEYAINMSKKIDDVLSHDRAVDLEDNDSNEE